MARFITPEKRLAIYIRDGFTCCYCGKDLKNAHRDDINLDHLVCAKRDKRKNFSVKKLENGLSVNHETNLVTACMLCNKRRGMKSWKDYATGGAIDRINKQIAQPLNIALAKAIFADKTGKYDR